jgi:LPS-assembly protein
MRRCAPIAAVVLCTTAFPARPQGVGAALGPQREGEVELTADRIVYDWEQRKLVLDGHVVATRGTAILRAARGLLDRRAGILRLEGGVLAIQGRQVLVAEEAVVDLESRSADLKAATLFLKDRTAPPPQLLRDRAAVRAAGKNALILTGKRIRQLPSGALIAEGVTMTPCDCAGEPDFELSAPEVEVKDDRARLKNPRLGLLGASLPLLVPISLPLTDRQSGLLFPPLQYAPSTTGFGTQVPVFLTLGRSYDVTIAPGVFTGNGGPDANARAADQAGAIGLRTVSGPRLGLQFRYAPLERTAGQLDAELIDDLAQHDSTRVVSSYPGEAETAPGRGLGGLRGVLRVSHRTDAEPWTAVAQGTVATDNMILVDTQPRDLDRYLDALRSQVGIVRTQGLAALGLEATFLQDVRIVDGSHPDRRLFGPERRATFQRLPSVFGQLAPMRIGPFAVSAELSAARFAPFTALDLRERDTGFGPTDLGAGAASTPVPVADPLGLGRGRAVRVDAFPRVSWAATGLPVLVSVDLGARADAWLVEDDPARNRRRAYALASARAQVSLQRAFGALLHTIEPAVELRAITPSLRSGGPPIGDPFDAGGRDFDSSPAATQQGVAAGQPMRGNPAVLLPGVPAARRPYDELDGAAPQDGETLATVRVGQTLWTRGAPGRAPGRMARLDLSQNVVLRAGDESSRVGEAGAAGSVQLGPLGAGASAQYDWSLRTLTSLGGSAGLRSARGDELHGSFSFYRAAASERIRAATDELFAAARVAADPGSLFGRADFGGSAALPLRRQGLRLSYNATRLLGPLPPAAAEWEHLLALTYETPCRCAGIQLSADLFFHAGKLQRSAFGVMVDLKSLGSFATF